MFILLRFQRGKAYGNERTTSTELSVVVKHDFCRINIVKKMLYTKKTQQETVFLTIFSFFLLTYRTYM